MRERASTWPSRIAMASSSLLRYSSSLPGFSSTRYIGQLGCSWAGSRFSEPSPVARRCRVSNEPDPCWYSPVCPIGLHRSRLLAPNHPAEKSLYTEQTPYADVTAGSKDRSRIVSQAGKAGAFFGVGGGMQDFSLCGTLD